MSESAQDLADRLANLELLYSTEAYDEIRTAVAAIRKEHPELIELETWEARIDWAQGRKDSALERLERLFSAHPANETIAGELISLLETLERHEDARVREKDHLAAYFRSAPLDAALERLQVSLSPANAELVRMGFEFVEKRIPPGTFPEREAYLLLKARLASIASRTEYARLLSEALAEFPDSRLGNILQYEIHREKKDNAAAEASLLRILNVAPDDVSALTLYANLMLENLHTEKARALAEKALTHQPGNTPARLVLIAALLVQDEDELAEEEAQNLIDFDSGRREAWLGVLSVLESQGRYEKAAQITKWLRERLPEDPELERIDLEFRVRAHPTMKLISPISRMGILGPLFIYVSSVVLIAFGRNFLPQNVYVALSVLYILWVLSTWFWPPILRRLLQARK